ncbi:hypothetical protein BHE74_00003039 [Ensete ventricosum]|nr:hypothetical protein BHE74_00003039 [Ensete ventricosum]
MKNSWNGMIPLLLPTAPFKLLLNIPSLLPLGTTAAQQQQLADSETNIGASSSFFRRLASPAFLLFQSSNLCRGLRFLAEKPATQQLTYLLCSTVAPLRQCKHGVVLLLLPLSKSPTLDNKDQLVLITFLKLTQ